MPGGPVLVVGSSGRIGRVLLEGLECPMVRFDLPAYDVLSLGAVRRAAEGCEQVVHLAWDLATENFNNGGKDPRNVMMAANVLDAAVELGLARVVLASSVHASGLRLGLGAPSTPYGRSKRVVEALGRTAAARGLDVVAIRFGGLNEVRPRDPSERGLFLSLDDCVGAVSCALSAPVVPGRFTVFNAVSRSRWRRLPIRNQLGWTPSSLARTGSRAASE